MTYLLITEGRNDCETIRQIQNEMGCRQKFRIEEKGGVENVIKALSSFLKSSEMREFGLVVDADNDPGARWVSIRDKLNALGYASVPNILLENGVIIDGHGSFPKFGLWIMPSINTPGALEDFLVRLINPKDKLLSFSEDTIQTVEAIDKRFKDAHRVKAQLSTWLSWQEEPGTPFGQAIRKKYFDLAQDDYIAFKDWLSKLFHEANTA